MKGLLSTTLILFILLSSLLHISTCTFYTVTSDDHYYPNTTCHHCHNLQHYLLNITKYFTSNTQLLFLPGLHHLHTDLIIQDVHNISLIGSTANGTTLDTVIQCNSSVGILMNNITNLTMKNMIIKNCMTNSRIKDFKNKMLPICVIFLLGCFKVHMQCMEIYNTHVKTSLLAYNILEGFTLDKIKSKELRIVYTDNLMNLSAKYEQATLNVNQFELIAIKTESAFNTTSSVYDSHDNPLSSLLYPSCPLYNMLCPTRHEVTDSMKAYGIKIEIYQTTYSVTAEISNSTFESLNYDYLDPHMHFVDVTINSCNKSYQNTILIQDYNFINNRLSDTNCLLNISSLPCDTANGKKDAIKIFNCSFFNNSKKKSYYYTKSNKLNVYAEIYISGCLFQNDLLFFLSLSSIKHSILYIENSKFQFIATTKVIELFNLHMILIGPVIFSNIQAEQLIDTNSDITIYNYVQYSNVTASELITGSTQTNINLIENSYVYITNNYLGGSLFQLQSSKAYSYPFCRFQYYKEQIKGENKPHHTKIPLIFVDSNNNISKTLNENMKNVNCKWDPKSLYYGANPLKIYEHSVRLENNEMDNDNEFDTGLLCYCHNDKQPNCITNTLGPLYPGQSLNFFLALNSKITNSSSVPITVKIYDKDSLHSLCIVKSVGEAEQLVYKNCTKLSYNIFSESRTQCTLILYNIEYKFPTIYYVKVLECPAGFVLDNKTRSCDCDQRLTPYGIADKCNINDQTILRPANSWITATTHNNSYTYHISLHCPFHYCLPHSSHLNFSTPNSQCQFNRSGLLCGHCQQGLSTVFSSDYCQHCSNSYLLLIIPIAVVGIIMVFLLFYLNLTVTDGSINGFILYANIISINTPIFFVSTSNFTPTYTFISFANLDLGIQTCFYNGMDDYAKMWLQLAFSFYLIFIATLIIITSRYSITIQRLTARRALPVLATLFLLSYTKILRIVSSVLFSYSTITHLPNKPTTLVWSVDASIPLFGVKFTILFAFCIALFCALIPFNMILVFTKTLSQFNLINKFMPLIDAYRGPYDYNFYYWTGFQLIIRSAFFGISALGRNINLTVGIVLISVVIGIHGLTCPYKSTMQNVQELLYLFNLQTLYTVSLYGRDTINMTAVNILIAIAAVQFFIVVMYHVIKYVNNGKIKQKIQLIVDALRRTIRSKNQQQYELGDNWRHTCTIPEITYNYQEYREPLICQD